MLNSRALLRQLAMIFALAGLWTGLAPPAMAQSQGVLVTVNDAPITNYDIEMRVNLWRLLGDGRPPAELRKKALDSLIDEIAKIEEAKRNSVAASDKDIEDRIKDIAKRLGTDRAGLQAKLKSAKISEASLKQYFAAQIGFSRLIRGKYKENPTVSKAEVDQRLAQVSAELKGKVRQRKDEIRRQIMSDPRMKPVKIVNLMEIHLTEAKALFRAQLAADGLL